MELSEYHFAYYWKLALSTIVIGVAGRLILLFWPAG